MSIHQQAVSIIESCQTLLDRKGYDRVNVKDVTFHRTEITIHYSAEDDFQSSIEITERFHSGYFLFLQAETLEEIYKKIERLPSRRKRELCVLAQQTAKLGKSLESIQDEFVKEFIQNILDDATELHLQLEDLS